MTKCGFWNSSHKPNQKRSPVFVPMGLVLAGLILLPFDCVYNQIFAIFIIGIGLFSLAGRMSNVICCLISRNSSPDGSVTSCL